MTLAPLIIGCLGMGGAGGALIIEVKYSIAKRASQLPKASVVKVGNLVNFDIMADSNGVREKIFGLADWMHKFKPANGYDVNQAMVALSCLVNGQAHSFCETKLLVDFLRDASVDSGLAQSLIAEAGINGWMRNSIDFGLFMTSDGQDQVKSWLAAGRAK